MSSSQQGKSSKEWLYEFELGEVVKHGCCNRGRGRSYLNVAGHEAILKNRADVAQGAGCTNSQLP